MGYDQTMYYTKLTFCLTISGVFFSLLFFFILYTEYIIYFSGV